jgi:hypothetical protein
MTMENIIVILIVGVAAVFIGRHFFQKFKKKDRCDCGCSSCPVDVSSCESPEDRERFLKDSQKAS